MVDTIPPDGQFSLRETDTPDSTNELPTQEALEDNIVKSQLYSLIREEFRHAADERQNKTENIWMAATRNWRGVYSPQELQAIAEARARNPGTSSFFIRITKTKVQAAYGQELEILFANKKFPIGVEPTPVPEGVDEYAYLEPKDGPSVEDLVGELNESEAIGFAGDGQEIARGATQDSLIPGFKKKMSDLFTASRRLVSGVSPDKRILPQVHPAQRAANKMQKVIHDQLEEDDAQFALRRCAFEQVLLGTGVIKGPMNLYKDQLNYTQDINTNKITLKTIKKVVPTITSPTVWNVYPDPDAYNRDDIEFVIERHLLGRVALRKLMKNDSFDKEAIMRILQLDPDYAPEQWESEIRDNDTDLDRRRYEVLEYWGYIDESLARRLNLEFDPEKEILINAWAVKGEIIKLIMNPFNPVRIPYYFIPYEEHPNQLWGIGVPENMMDTQALMNAHMRAAIDNLRLSGNVIFEINEAMLSPGQDLVVYPGMTIKKTGGPPGQAMFVHSFPDVSQSHIAMFNKAKEIADEETGIFNFPNTGGQSIGRTASGLSMLLASAALNIKTVIKNIDHYLLKPLGRGYFEWNMQFNEENVEIRGDMNIIALGTSSLLQREVQSQRLLSFLQIAGGNPVTAPMINISYILKEIAKSLDLDPDKVVNDPEAQAILAELIAKTQGVNNGQGAGNQVGGLTQGGGAGGAGAVQGPSSTQDITGASGGGIAPSGVPQSGETGFTGNGV